MLHISLKEKLILLVALTLFVSCTIALIFFDHFFFSHIIDPRDVIGKAFSLSGRVQRKSPDLFEYLNLSKNDPIGNGDSLFTDKNSSLKVRLNNKSVVTLGPETLIVIRMQDGKFNIKVDQGDLDFDLVKESNLEVQTDEQSFLLNADEDKKFKIIFSKESGLVLDQEPSSEKIGNYKQQDSDQPKTKDPLHKKTELKKKRLDKNRLDTSADSPPNSSKELLSPSGLLESERRKTKIYRKGRLKFSPPNPKNGSLIFHQEGGEILLFCKEKCSHDCNLKVWLDQRLVKDKSYNQDRAPILQLEFGKSTAGLVHWELKDGQDVLTGQFKIMIFTNSDFSKAIKEGLNVEVLN